MIRKKKKSRSLWIMLAAIIALAALIFLLPSCGGDDAQKSTLVKVGEQAPDFTVEMTDSTRLSLQSLEGRVVLLNFWATWCPPCRTELEHMQADVIDRFAGRELVVLPISRGEERATVEEFCRKNGHTFPVGLDPKEAIYGLYATNYIPRNFLIDKTGRIVKITVGYTEKEFDELIEAIETELQK